MELPIIVVDNAIKLRAANSNIPIICYSQDENIWKKYIVRSNTFSPLYTTVNLSDEDIDDIVEFLNASHNTFENLPPLQNIGTSKVSGNMVIASKVNGGYGNDIDSEGVVINKPIRIISDESSLSEGSLPLIGDIVLDFTDDTYATISVEPVPVSTIFPSDEDGESLIANRCKIIFLCRNYTSGACTSFKELLYVGCYKSRSDNYPRQPHYVFLDGATGDYYELHDDTWTHRVNELLSDDA